jgi:RNA ligase (TIGR02306 family)
MSKFEVLIQPIFIKPHPNADRLEIGNVGSPEGWQVVVAKGRFESGDLCAYIGENAVCPEWLLKHYGYWNEEKNIGMLAGSKGTRVKALKLRDEFSLGIVLPVKRITVPANMLDDSSWDCFLSLYGENSELYVDEGDEVSEFLGVTKYDPPIPISMSGEVCNVLGYTLKYDIENWKKYPDTFKDGEEVIFTEKLHGTWCCIGYNADLVREELPEGNIIITSKGLSDQGLAFKDNAANKNNLYLNVFRNTTNEDTGNHIIDRFKAIMGDETSFYILGEIFGPVQDLRYGLNTPQFRVFDVWLGHPCWGRYISDYELSEIAALTNTQLVPELYRGPFSIAVMELHTNGQDTISGQHMREGLVISSCYTRAKRKSVSQAYLLRKNKNATEFQ